MPKGLGTFQGWFKELNIPIPGMAPPNLDGHGAPFASPGFFTPHQEIPPGIKPHGPIAPLEKTA